MWGLKRGINNLGEEREKKLIFTVDINVLHHFLISNFTPFLDFPSSLSDSFLENLILILPGFI